MGHFEYKVLPTPRRTKRAKGVKGEPARFAHMLTELMNVEAAEGWEYYKSETLPTEIKNGLFKSRIETTQTVLVFRRSLKSDDDSEILSITPAAEPRLSASREETVAEPSEPAAKEPLRAVKSDEEVDLLAFDEDDKDPLKNLVDHHRGTKPSE